jgi:3' terminal RNA ribose 2'-O-methyltransferase Hen1
VVTPTPGGCDLIRSFFSPLGWQVAIVPVAGGSRYATVTLRGEHRLADALSHLYVLIPALDAEKHYWVGDDEVDKLLAKAGAWIAARPFREQIAHRYLKKRTSLSKAALARLAPEVLDEEEAEAAGGRAVPPEEALETPMRLNEIRLEAVHSKLRELGAWRVADLGCGDGKLLQRLAQDRKFMRLFGVDASVRDLEKAARRLKLDRAGADPERITLMHGALTYRDLRWKEVDAACLVEVIEHLDLAGC